MFTCSLWAKLKIPLSVFAHNPLILYDITKAGTDAQIQFLAASCSHRLCLLRAECTVLFSDTADCMQLSNSLALTTLLSLSPATWFIPEEYTGGARAEDDVIEDSSCCTL